MCPDSYVAKVENRDRVMCKKQENKICPFVRWCNNSECWKPLDSQESCRLRSKFEIPQSASRVRFEKKGNLYIEIENSVIVLKNPFTFVPKYVTLYKLKDKYVINKSKGYGE